MAAMRPGQAARHRACLLPPCGPSRQRDAFFFSTKLLTTRLLSVHLQGEKQAMSKAIFPTLRIGAALTFSMLLAQPSFSYSVLTHQAIIDSSWKESLKPLLLKRFPGATAEQLREAHAYAYGGAIIQDMGYYPFGSKFFTDLAHYVRSGDFIESMIAEASDLNEYAFALGALAHYA